jgi:hypothetical protein
MHWIYAMALESCFWIPERQVFTQGREYARAWWGTVCPATLVTQILCKCQGNLALCMEGD